ncbi:integrase [Phyllobacterium phragmitis]|uniref:Integrase n=1 Tax=Phyllobacterium phragmitis TaxID=2670329 RepID=A0A2S9ILI9_9HYPH|nr:site-specific integrase [Phyllobacterium phragmitis]PRD41378.1 integrase [Phyllobacterium phragmitis]
MAKALTGASLTKLKADPSKRLEIPDGVLTGLYLVIQPTGRKSWAVRYRAYGKPRKMVLGNYLAGDNVELAGAELKRIRAEASDILDRVRQGIDPAVQKQISKKQAHNEDEADRTRLDSVARLFLARYAKPKNRSWKETARLLGLVPDKAKIAAAETDKDKAAIADDPKTFAVVKEGVVDKWGHRPIDSMTRSEVIALLDDLVDRGSPIIANRTLAALRKLFNWSIQRDLLKISPCEKVKPPATEKARDRVLTDNELKALWQGCEAMGWPFGRLFQMLVLTGQRREEVGAMAWREIDGNTWTLPRERVKTDKAHEVALSATALGILEQLPRISGSDFVFTTNGQNPVSGFSKAKDALDAKMLEIMRKEAEDAGEDPDSVKLEPWRLHDIRRTVASGMAKLGISLAVIEKILNHTSGSFGGIVGVYQRHEFSEEKRRALDAWARYVEGIVIKKSTENVIPMRAAQ